MQLCLYDPYKPTPHKQSIRGTEHDHRVMFNCLLARFAEHKTLGYYCEVHCSTHANCYKPTPQWHATSPCYIFWNLSRPCDIDTIASANRSRRRSSTEVPYTSSGPTGQNYEASRNVAWPPTYAKFALKCLICKLSRTCMTQRSKQSARLLKILCLQDQANKK